MNPDPLPLNLRDLEDRLARRELPDPAGDLRTRVLAAAAATPPPAVRRWGVAWRAAAAIILTMNLGMSVANGFRFHRLAETTETIHSEPRPIDPERYDSDDRIPAFVGSAAAHWTPGADSAELSRAFFRGEDRRWALP
jgi:hypothetical protein